ncbi:MAG: outer membrane beta-barrel protein [Bacteroidetes bacterium]|nr:outer membrane beta-barrel protein [Bacteroidota bacterium]
MAVCGAAQIKKRNFRQREIGVFGGASYYIGDLNPRKHFFPSHPGLGVFFRYTTNYRFAFRFGVNYGTVSASDANSKEPDQLERNLNFHSPIYDGHAVAEFNFVDYRIGNDKHYFSMFIFAGLGMCYMNPHSNVNGVDVPLVNLRTEGQSKSYSKYQVTIPFGVGFKWNVLPRIGLGVEWGPRKMFTDYLDDVSGAYSSNGFGIPGTMRGNPRSKDWYFFYGFTLSFKLPQAAEKCPGVGI